MSLLFAKVSFEAPATHLNQGSPVILNMRATSWLVSQMKDNCLGTLPWMGFISQLTLSYNTKS